MTERNIITEFLNSIQLEANAFLEFARVVHLLKGEKLSDCSNYNRKETYILIEGIVRGVIIFQDGKEVTECICDRYGVAVYTDLSSVFDEDIKRSPGQFIEAIVDSSFIAVDTSVILNLIKENEYVLRAYTRGLSESMIEHWEHMAILNLSATEKYRWFLRKFGKKTVERIPSWIVAEYINIAPPTLSRIRKKLKEDI